MLTSGGVQEMTILRLRAAYHVANDFERLLTFYQDGLGLPVKFRDQDRWAEFKLEETRFALSSQQEAAPGSGAGAVSLFQADCLDGLCDRMALHGGEVMTIRDMGSHGRVATVRDPEGKIFQIIAFDGK